jgi:hypothetical protein
MNVSNNYCTDSFHQQTGLKFKEEKLLNCYIWSIALNGAQSWTLRKVDKKYLASFEPSMPASVHCTDL